MKKYIYGFILSFGLVFGHCSTCKADCWGVHPVVLLLLPVGMAVLPFAIAYETGHSAVEAYKKSKLAKSRLPWKDKDCPAVSKWPETSTNVPAVEVRCKNGYLEPQSSGEEQ